MIHPFNSFVISLYNKENHIHRSINSVISQTYTNFEVLIVNDGSTDFSLDIVNKNNNPLIKVINKKIGRVSSAHNLGIEKAQGEIVAFMDADDCWLRSFLSETVILVEEFSEAMVFATAVYQNTGKRMTYPHFDRNYKRGWKGIIFTLLRTSILDFREKFVFLLWSIPWILEYIFCFPKRD